MTPIEIFKRALPALTKSHTDRAVALLWFFTEKQIFEQRTAAELASDLHDLGFPKPNSTRLAEQLKQSKYTNRGSRSGSFQIDSRYRAELETKFGDVLPEKKVQVSDAVVPNGMVSNTRLYLERIVAQINGSYDNGWYDACGVLCRRLIETLIVECYLANGIRSKIEVNGKIRMLESLVTTIKSETEFKLARNSGATIDAVKAVGDTAAHDRTHITQQQDIDDIKLKMRPLVSDLLHISMIKR